jgi:hypothetical protein
MAKRVRVTKGHHPIVTFGMFNTAAEIIDALGKLPPEAQASTLITMFYSPSDPACEGQYLPDREHVSFVAHLKFCSSTAEAAA